MDIVIIGLAITSSWGNGHATTFRALVRELKCRGHRVQFLERDVPWYAENRDFEAAPGAGVDLYQDLEDLAARHGKAIRSADAVVVGSYVPEGVEVCEWVLGRARGITAFYDIDTPVTLANLVQGKCDYLEPGQIPRFDLYFSFAGGRTLQRLRNEFGARRPRALYCSVDTTKYFPEVHSPQWDLGYLGTYSKDRQPGLNRLLGEPARRWPGGRFVVAGPQYPPDLAWSGNVERYDHLPPGEHRRFYNSQRFTLNITREDMIRAGHSPSVRLFEAAACGIPIISDYWEGLEDFFEIGTEILVPDHPDDVLRILADMDDDAARAVGAAARRRILSAHTARHRAEELEREIFATFKSRRESLSL